MAPDVRQVVGVDNHLAAADVDFVLQGDGDGLWRESLAQLAFIGHDALNAALFHAGQRHHFVADAYDTAGHLAAEAAEVKVGAQDILHRIAEVVEVAVGMDGHGLKEVEQGRAAVPRRAVALLHDIVAFACGEGEAGDIVDAEVVGEFAVLRYYIIEDLLVEAHEVHLVHGEHDVLDAEERDEERVAARLCDDALARIHEDDGEIGCGAACNHVACILLMSRGVGDDELTLVRGEIAVGHIDGDAFLALCLEAVKQQGIVDAVAGIADALAVALEGCELVVVEFLGIEEEAPDEGALAVIDGAGGEQTQEVFLLVGVEVCFDIEGFFHRVQKFNGSKVQ